MLAQSTLVGRLTARPGVCAVPTCPMRPQPVGRAELCVITFSKRKGAKGDFYDFDDQEFGFLPDDDRYGDFTGGARRPLSSRDDLDYNDFADMPDDKSFKDNQLRTVNGKQLLINREIKAQVVRVLAGEGGKEMLGVKPFPDALKLAQDLGVDLVLLNPDATPPLCRLVDWSKYKYETEKEQKVKAAKATTVETKEVRLRPSTDSNDRNTKLKSALKFLQKGNKVKIVMKFEGRELQFKDQGKEVLLKFIEDVGEVGRVDGPLNFKTGTFTVMLVPGGKGSAPAAAAAPREATAPAPAASLPPAAPPAVPQTAAAPNGLPPPPPMPAPGAPPARPGTLPPPPPVARPVGTPSGLPPPPMPP
eukprot:CAMPEP_0202868492 /NCGR_PEP_ID=MMETSP1391-20130828/10908_1 /ASSEMBLY_ACC=CAM_ASM_000867 /TAXON_ID=1034604 /ORGANISM="Chlamydomonas leiostraca, Strain SAG 11-49" /LENGTH=360 /DNA_ID=CAMNT_0049548671 /DNA_START=99 /DNA_END=1177 /DNA_ORIENTATION=+